jgi:diguanylate cyclase
MIVRESVEKTRQTLQSVKGLEEELKRASAAIDALKVSLNEAQKAAITDSLTGLFNRRHFQRCLDIAMEEAEKDRRPLSVVMADVDHFKSVNDTWGHQTGDQVIQFFARLVASNTKGKDIIARYGGEEFVMLLPDTAAAEAARVAEAIRAMLEQRVLRKRLTNELLGRITVSLGVAEAEPGEDRDSLIEAADSALYEAKRLGRNRVAIAPPRRELARARA